VEAAFADDPFELVVDLAGHEPQRQVAQRGQVRVGEEPLQGERGAFRRIDVAVAHPLPERVRAHVHELDLVGGPDHFVGDALADRHAQDRLDRVGDRLDVLDVAGADDLDAGVADRSTSCQRFSRAEPGTLVWASSSTRATAGWRAMIASASISSTATPRYSTRRRGTISRPSS
jgi:hypothetical protein